MAREVELYYLVMDACGMLFEMGLLWSWLEKRKSSRQHEGEREMGGRGDNYRCSSGMS